MLEKQTRRYLGKAMPLVFLRQPLTKKIFRENILAIGAAMGCIFLLLLLFTLYSGQKNLRTEAQYKAKTLAASIASSLQQRDLASMQDFILNASQSSDALSVIVYDQHAQPVVAWTVLSKFDSAGKLPSSELISEVRSDLQLGQINVAAPVLSENHIIGKIQVGSSLRTLYLLVLRLVLIGALLILVLAVLCGYYLTKLQLARLGPVFDLATITEQVANLGDYSQRAKQYDGHELNYIGRHFNQMMQRIESWESDRQSEVRERMEAERRLDILANHDSVTKLPNRNYFHKLLKHCVNDAVTNKQLAALMFIDMDNFKAMNDQFGYDAGDLILATISNRLCSALRNTDTLCRVDGDEFAAILPQIDSVEMAQNLAERLIHAVNQPMNLRGKKIILTASIGIACCPLHAKEQRLFLHNTDLALKKAKAAGKNNFCLFSATEHVVTS
jgi:diguanylate cyclase (GGDEF)-like protein